MIPDDQAIPLTPGPAAAPPQPPGNPEPSIVRPPPAPAPQPAPPNQPGSTPENQPPPFNQLTLSAQPAPESPVNPQPANPSPAPDLRRPVGKIASLPKAQRDTINRLLLDGNTYSLVEQEMAKVGVLLNSENLSNWFHTGFQDYLAARERLDFQRARYEAASDLLQDIDTSKLPEADLQTAAAQIYDLLGRFTPASLSETMAKDPNQYTRLLNALSRLARESLQFQKYREACLQARAEVQKLRDPHRKLTEEETLAVVDHLDHILGFK